jgi:hypothetical protein
MMENNQRLFFCCLAISGLSLVLSFYYAHSIALALSVFVPVVMMVYARKHSMTWLAHFSLAGFTGLSAAGILLGVPLIPIVIGSAAALAGWDLLLEMQSGIPSTKGYEGIHLKYLGAVISLGILLVIFGSRIQIKMPFSGMLVLVIVIIFFLNKFAHNLFSDNV